jgi:hypothetical protein
MLPREAADTQVEGPRARSQRFEYSADPTYVKSVIPYTSFRWHFHHRGGHPREVEICACQRYV